MLARCPAAWLPAAHPAVDEPDRWHADLNQLIQRKRCSTDGRGDDDPFTPPAPHSVPHTPRVPGRRAPSRRARRKHGRPEARTKRVRTRQPLSRRPGEDMPRPPRRPGTTSRFLRLSASQPHITLGLRKSNECKFICSSGTTHVKIHILNAGAYQCGAASMSKLSRAAPVLWAPSP